MSDVRSGQFPPDPDTLDRMYKKAQEDWEESKLAEISAMLADTAKSVDTFKMRRIIREVM